MSVITPLCTALLLAASLSSADSDGAAAHSGTYQVTVGPQYKAGGIHRWLWGTDYRDLWTEPIQVEVLDLQGFAGGLKPAFRVGGRETKGLAMKGKDGLDYTFRSIDKDPSQILPEELRDTWVRNIVQDQMVAQHPAGAFVVDELQAAAGILRTPQKLVVMPDDPALGEFRQEFAGVVGQIYEFPGAKSQENPGFHGATEILKHDKFYARMQASPDDRADARAFLKARLLDIMIGDWDRHRDQWRWAKLPDKPDWQPIPDDRDQAFSRYEGLVLAVARQRVFIFQDYGPNYPDMKGLTYNGWEQDRELLAGLDKAVWQETAAELKSQITDAVIEKAVQRMPPEYFQRDGQRLIHHLKARRDALPEGAERFYAHISDKIKVYLTEQPELVEAQRSDNGDLELRVRRAAGETAAAGGEPYFQRTFHRAETQEIQVYLRGGNDRVVTEGRPGGIRLRVVGTGQDVVDDTKGGGTQFYDSAGGELKEGPGSSISHKTYTPPPPPKNAPWIPPRDWGRETVLWPVVGYGGLDVGLVLGATLHTVSHGFRKDPYASRQVLSGAWTFDAETFLVNYRGERRFENSASSLRLNARASGIEQLRFFGFGNDTSDLGDPKADFFRVKQQQYSLTPSLVLGLARNLSLSVGPTLTYATSRNTDEVTLVNTQRPYGFGNFSELGGTATLELDTRVAATRTPGGAARSTIGWPRSGTLVTVRGEVYPSIGDVTEVFKTVDGSASAYLTLGGDKAPTLALRAGGKKVFGTAPFFEAAYLGGGISTGQGLIRGLSKQRYGGDAAVYGNADLRIYVSRFKIFLPGEWGVLGFADGGRIYLDGESSDTWHHGFGGGLWFAWLDRSNAFSLSYARSEGRGAIYFRGGFAF